MREIKFRGWHTGANKMFSAEEMAADQLTLLPTGNFINVHGGSTAMSTIYQRDKFIPLQFTGLKDKNGKEIYEGDIFRIEEEADGPDRIIYVVVTWVKEWAMFCTLLVEDEYKAYLSIGLKALDEPLFWLYTLEDTNSRKHFLCGNIYQNPELLNDSVLIEREKDMKT